MGDATKASCGAAFPIYYRVQHAVAASAVAIPMGAANGGSHGVFRGRTLSITLLPISTSGGLQEEGSALLGWSGTRGTGCPPEPFVAK